jgi:hypothetical protein
MKYLMIHWIDDAARPAAGSPEDLAYDRAVEAWDAVMKGRGAFAGGAWLAPAATATKVCLRDGGILVTDGPFAETKEQIAGFIVLDCADLAEAVEVSSRHPAVAYGTFELRPYMH